MILIIVLTITFGSIFFTDSKAIQTSSLLQNSSEVDTKISDLSQILNDYFLYQNDSQIVAWRSTINTISNDASNVNMDQAQAAMANLLQNDLAVTDHLFNQTAAYLQNIPRNQSVRANPQFQSLWSQLN